MPLRKSQRGAPICEGIQEEAKNLAASLYGADEMPGEVITDAIVQYLREGKRPGMLIPDPADSTLRTLRVVKN